LFFGAVATIARTIFSLVGRGFKYKTAVVEHSVNPRWDESFDVPVGDTSVTQIQLALFDDDGPLNKADNLGRWVTGCGVLIALWRSSAARQITNNA